jgi:hypothetical protein
VWDSVDVGIGAVAFDADGEHLVGQRFSVYDSDAASGPCTSTTCSTSPVTS